jgi:DNA-binding LacI/PurR family transcriptional regulator
MREPTMADIADHLGVSRQLVSIVLRDMPGASDGTRARVKSAATELGYRPHQGARMLRQYSRRQIGVSFAPANASDSDIVEAIYSAVAGHRMQVVLSARTRMRTTEQSVDELLEYRCAALIVIGPELDDRALRGLEERVGVPLVTVDQGSDDAVHDVVRSAGDVGIEMLARHLAAGRQQARGLFSRCQGGWMPAGRCLGRWPRLYRGGRCRCGQGAAGPALHAHGCHGV